MSDLHFTHERADRDEEIAIASALEGEGSAVQFDGDRISIGGRSRTSERRHLLLPGLWALHDAVGWISPGGLNSLSAALGVPPAEAYGVATFYDLFHTSPPPPVTIRRCDDLACRVLVRADDELDSNREIAMTPPIPNGDVVHTACLGQCDRGAAALVQRRGEPISVSYRSDSSAVVDGGTHPRLLRRVLAGDTGSLASYRAHGGFEVRARALELGPAAILELVSASGLQGRGGAAFPTGAKWLAVAEQTAAIKHVIANADESEPGTFKDRVLMERDPFALVESMLVAGYAIGASRGWVYVRGEYPEARARLAAAIDECRAAGLLGLEFDIELRRGAGAYICGEETALLESIEGYRGEPRNKPPYPTTHGLFGQPTVINNVETLLNVLDVVALGAQAWRSVGTEQSPGTRLFSLSGHVQRPGVYEHPMGVSLRRVIDAAGGPDGDRRLQAVLLGGAAGVLVGPDQLDIELSFEGARTANVTLGSGVVMVLDDSVDLRDFVGRATEFFAHESCGQCVPCRIGTQRQMEQVRAATFDDALLGDLDRVMTDASICGLGQTAASLVRSARALKML